MSQGICRKPPLQKKGIFKIFSYLLICAKEIQKETGFLPGAKETGFLPGVGGKGGKG